MMGKTHAKLKDKGFTIIELLAVMAVIGILTTIVVGGYRQTQRRGRDAQRKSDLKQMSQALEVYLSDHGTYPSSSVNGKIMGCPAGTTECEWGTGQFSDSTGNIYFVNLPDDPLSSQDYFYRAFDSNRKYQIFAFLENPKDQDCLGGNCSLDPSSLPSGVTCSSSEVCNYAVYSPNVRLAETYSQPTPTPTPTLTPTPTSTPTPTATLTPTPTPTPAGPSWWNANYLYRRGITVTASTAAVPNSYSVSLTFGHQSLVSLSKSLSSGNDVRVLYWNGTSWLELDRSLDELSSWNNASTRIWFRTQAAISASGSDGNYYLYYGNTGAVSPPANKANIYLFFDDFEAGNLGKWTIVDGLWQVATDNPRTGTYSLKYPAESSADRHIVANPALNEANIYLDAWWRFSDVASSDLAQGFRRPAGAHSQYETNIEGSSGWDIAKEINAGWSELSTNAGTPTANTWTRIGIAIYGTGMRVFKDGMQINPASGSLNVGTELASGNIVFRKWNVGTGQAWWVDDVVARKYVNPEPTTSLGTEATQ